MCLCVVCGDSVCIVSAACVLLWVSCCAFNVVWWMLCVLCCVLCALCIGAVGVVFCIMLLVGWKMGGGGGGGMEGLEMQSEQETHT